MEASIQFNVPVEIVLHRITLNFIVLKGFNQLGEHLGNGVFSSEEELASSIRNAQKDGRTSVEIESFHVFWAFILLNDFLNISQGVLIVP